ncbi:MAG: hypothetical protein ABIG11_09095 [bacterium]
MNACINESKYFILGDHHTAIEVKGTDRAAPQHLKGLKAFGDEYKVKNCIVVSMDPKPRLVDGISILPWKIFLGKLWSGDLIQ